MEAQGLEFYVEPNMALQLLLLEVRLARKGGIFFPHASAICASSAPDPKRPLGFEHSIFFIRPPLLLRLKYFSDSVECTHSLPDIVARLAQLIDPWLQPLELSLSLLARDSSYSGVCKQEEPG